MIEEIKKIPHLPQLTMQLIHQAFQEEPDIQLVASTVEKDPAFTAKLFKAVNSAYYGLRVPVDSVSLAISILGLDSLRSIIVSIGLGDYFKQNTLGKALDIERLCLHSMSTAVILQETGQRLGIKKADQLYLVGLLHDLGIIALDSLPDSDYGKVLRLVKGGKNILEAERQVFGMDNLEVWHLIAKTWGFPSDIIELFEGNIDEIEELPTSWMVSSASRMSDTLGYGFIPPERPEQPARWDFSTLLDKKAMQEICRNVQTQVAGLGEIMELPEPDASQLQRTLVMVNHQLSQSNIRFEKLSKDLAFRVEVMEELTQVVTGIVRSFDSDSLSYYLLETIMEGFHVDGSFILHRDKHGVFTGFSTVIHDQSEADLQQISLPEEQLSPSMLRCMEHVFPLKVDYPAEEPFLREFLGDIPLAWLLPIFIRGRFSSLLGIGIMDGKSLKFNSKDFGKALKIVGEEVGLSMDNSRLFKRMRKEARTDALTSIFNRRTIMKILFAEFARIKRHPAPLVVAIFDIDNFKAINDTLGHLTGDQFLKNCAQLFKKSVRESDFIGRYGGDEFLAVLPDTHPNDALVVVERIRRRIADLCEQYDGPEIGKQLSVSCGIAGFHETMADADELIYLADKALYDAKETGRNQCKLADQPMVSLL